VQNQKKAALKAILNDLVVMEEGEIVGYKLYNNQDLINQTKSLRQRVDFDFAQGSPKAIFKPTISAIEEAAIDAAQMAESSAAADSIIDSKLAYREWTTKYNNDKINPYRNRTNRDYSKLYSRNTDVDNFNRMKDLISHDPLGKEILSSTKRQIVDQKLNKVLENPRNIHRLDLDNTYLELDSVLSPSELAGVKGEVEATAKRFPSQMRIIKHPKVESPDLKAVQKYTGKSPEDIIKKMGTRSGIREIREKMSGTPANRKIFDRLSSEKVREMFSKGEVSPKLTGNDVYKTLNKTENFNLISELTSEKEALELHKMAKKLDSKKFTNENVKKLSSSYLKFKLVRAVISL
jgi:hypothetical protein